jgi:hypothetical protein
VFALEVLLGALLLAGIAVAASHEGRIYAEPEDSKPDLGLPADRLLRSDDIARLRLRPVVALGMGIRGYRFADVDEVLARVHQSLAAWEEQSRPEAPPGMSGGRHPGPRRSPSP